MERLRFLLLVLRTTFLLLTTAQCTFRPPADSGKSAGGEEVRAGSPADHLSPWITCMTYFGQRADSLLDGKEILSLKKTFGQAFTVDRGTKIIRPVTLNYFTAGYTWALYLSNADILLSGARQFNPADPSPSRTKYPELWVLNKDMKGPLERLTYSSDYRGYKAANPVVSDDGHYMVFQMAKVGDPASVGRGIFVYDFTKAPASGK